ncbi:MAG TPA: TetR/AcrR family transcriptional regulator [Anaerolineaceae bacterium]|nr:TetR/AcrR family transcriptional regulator [Anaerolineaceae bacterium]
MSEEPASIEEKIILTTIDCIERYGFSGATNRRISQAAGVNIAAINYYFRSKKALIQRVMEITLHNAFDLSNVPSMPEATVQQRCAAIFAEILEGGIRYPNLTRAHFHDLLVEDQPDTLLQHYVRQFVDEQAQELLTRGLTLPPDEIKLALIQIFSAVAMAVLAPSLIEQAGIDLHDPAARQSYVKRLVEKLLVP